MVRFWCIYIYNSSEFRNYRKYIIIKSKINDLNGNKIIRSSIKKYKFKNVDLRNSVFEGIDFREEILDNTNFEECVFKDCKFKKEQVLNLAKEQLNGIEIY